MQEYKEKLKQEKVTSLSSQISREWRALPEEEQNKWKGAAERDKLRYNAEKSLYNGPWRVSAERPRKVCSWLMVRHLLDQLSKLTQNIMVSINANTLIFVAGSKCAQETTLCLPELLQNSAIKADSAKSRSQEHGYLEAARLRVEKCAHGNKKAARRKGKARARCLSRKNVGMAPEAQSRGGLDPTGENSSR